jgi:hypothetical protein
VRHRRRSKSSDGLGRLPLALVACTLASGCGGASLQTALEVKDETRHPDGVVVEPAPAIPPAEEHASAQDGVVALRQPISDEQIGEMVHKYIRVFTRGDGTQFDDLLDPGAVLFGDNGRSAGRATLLQSLRIRQQQHAQEYRKLGDDVARLDRMERWSSDDLGPFTDPPRPAEMQKGDVFVRVPLNPHLSVAGDPLFRNTLIMLLRRGADHVLRIAGLAETDSP